MPEDEVPDAEIELWPLDVLALPARNSGAGAVGSAVELAGMGSKLRAFIACAVAMAAVNGILLAIQLKPDAGPSPWLLCLMRPGIAAAEMIDSPGLPPAIYYAVVILASSAAWGAVAVVAVLFWQAIVIRKRKSNSDTTGRAAI